MSSEPHHHQPGREAPVFEVNGLTFEDIVLKSADPVLVEFRADWCSQCATLDPMLKSMANEKRGDIKFAAVDVEENGILADEYSVRAIPTLLLFRDGIIQETIVGTTTELDLRQILERYY